MIINEVWPSLSDIHLIGNWEYVVQVKTQLSDNVSYWFCQDEGLSRSFFFYLYTLFWILPLFILHFPGSSALSMCLFLQCNISTTWDSLVFSYNISTLYFCILLISTKFSSAFLLAPCTSLSCLYSLLVKSVFVFSFLFFNSYLYTF